MTAGFLGTAWLAIAFVFLHYLFVFDPHENPFQDSYQSITDGSDDLWKPNPIDVLTKKLINKVLRWMKLGSGWASGLEMVTPLLLQRLYTHLLS